MKSSLHWRGLLQAGFVLGVSLAWPRAQACQFDALNFKLIPGTYLRLLGLKLPLQVGRSYPMNLLFRQSGLVLATLTVDFGRFS